MLHIPIGTHLGDSLPPSFWDNKNVNQSLIKLIIQFKLIIEGLVIENQMKQRVPTPVQFIEHEKVTQSR